MNRYTTIYSDKSGNVQTTIQNEYSENGINNLIFEIDGVRFKGSAFDDFELIDLANYTQSQLKRFTFNKVPVFESNEFVWVLCNCSIEVHIPIIIFDIKEDTEIKTILIVDLSLGKPMKKGGLNKEKASFNLEINNLQYTSESYNFESALLQMQKDMLPRFYFKNCFSCHYSDYSPYGTGFFGSLMCFKGNKLDYLSSTTKEDFLKLASHGFISVQESYLCEQFLPRERDTGYRGWPFDINGIKNTDI